MAFCGRCGAHSGATKTELHYSNGKVKAKILCDGCKARYAGGAAGVSLVVDLDPIDAVDPLMPKGQGTCPGCGKDYDDVRKHQQRTGHLKADVVSSETE